MDAPTSEMRRLTVRLRGGLERYTSMQREVEIWVCADVILADIQNRLGIPKGEVGLFVLDRQIVDESARVADASIVELYPMFGGG
jgi:hypothetical protein